MKARYCAECWTRGGASAVDELKSQAGEFRVVAVSKSFNTIGICAVRREVRYAFLVLLVKRGDVSGSNNGHRVEQSQ